MSWANPEEDACLGGLTVAVAVSGGTDSAAAALKLAQARCRLLGVSALLTDTPAGREAPRRAQALCDRLGIGHHTIDLREQFSRLVIEPFIAEYARGRTPNPCVRCNEHVKFGLLLAEALKAGADRLATGHYVRLEWSPGGHPYLRRAADLHKDQSYVLHHLSAQQLARSVFVHGAATRAANERLVASSGLGVAPLPESQDVCFAPGGDYGALLRAAAPRAFEPGPIVDSAGSTIGTHGGLAGYTVGQRRGLGIGGPGGRWFVLHLDPRGNRLVVGHEGDLWASWCDIDDLRLSPGALPPGFDQADGGELRARVMVRYNGAVTPARVHVTGDRAMVRFEDPVRAPTPGQSAVFYAGDTCLGGGVIDRTELTERFDG